MMLTKSSVAKASVARKASPAVRARVVANAKAGNWFPGKEIPAYLDAANLPGTYGFDPLELGKDSGALKRFQEAELIHCRWAMLGVAGALAVEVLGYGNWYDAPLWAVNGGKPTYFGAEVPFDLNTLTGIEVVMFAIAEGLRNNETDQSKKCYPGGAFDPMGMSKGANAEELKLKELKNGRLAMVAFIGFIGQHAATGKGPVAALSEHLANPWGANFATNGTSLPF